MTTEKAEKSKDVLYRQIPVKPEIAEYYKQRGINPKDLDACYDYLFPKAKRLVINAKGSYEITHNNPTELTPAQRLEMTLSILEQDFLKIKKGKCYINYPFKEDICPIGSILGEREKDFWPMWPIVEETEYNFKFPKTSQLD